MQQNISRIIKLHRSTKYTHTHTHTQRSIKKNIKFENIDIYKYTDINLQKKLHISKYYSLQIYKYKIYTDIKEKNTDLKILYIYIYIYTQEKIIDLHILIYIHNTQRRKK